MISTLIECPISIKSLRESKLKQEKHIALAFQSRLWSFTNLEVFGCQLFHPLLISCCGQWPLLPSLASANQEIQVESASKYDPQFYLSYVDIAVDNCPCPTVISIQPVHLKTGPFTKWSRTQDDLCPVKALLSYLSMRGDVAGALFMWEDLKPLYILRQSLSTRLMKLFSPPVFQLLLHLSSSSNHSFSHHCRPHH